MSNKQIYRQVKLQRNDGIGSAWIDIAWIPAKLAKVGKTLTIDTKPDGERDGWVVLEIWGSREESEVKSQTEAQREFSKKLDKKNRRPTE